LEVRLSDIGKPEFTVHLHLTQAEILRRRSEEANERFAIGVLGRAGHGGCFSQAL
jgi:hypothetical protein